MKNLKWLSLLSSSLGIVLIFFACKKDKVITSSCAGESGIIETPCANIIFSEPVVILLEAKTDTQYTEPCFSPFTDDEFVYIRTNVGTPSELVKHIISTQTDEVLCTSSQTLGFHMEHPDWGTQNKIIFNVGTGSSGIGFIIDNNGSNLNQFLPSNVNFVQPKFNGNGTKIIAGGATLPNFQVPIYDLMANTVDSFPFRLNSINIGIGFPAFIDGNFIDGLLSYADYNQVPFENGLGYMESDTTFSPVLTTNNPDGYLVTDVDKFQNLIYYVTYGLGLYQFNESTGVTTLLQEMCDSRKIFSISVSQFSGNILIEEMTNTKISEAGGIDIQSNIYLFNPNTLEKTPLLVE